MRKLSTLTSIAGIGAVLTLMAACQTVATNDAELAASKKEFLLAQSGFKVITVTTPKQQQAINGLSPIQGLGCEVQRETILCFSHGDEGQDLVGKQKQYNAYKGALQAHAGEPPSGSAGSTRSTADEPSAYDDIRDCGAPAHRGRAVRWFWSDGHGVFRRLVANERSVPR